MRVRLWPRAHATYDVIDERGRVLGSVWDYGGFGWAAFEQRTGGTPFEGFYPSPEAAARAVAPDAEVKT